MRGRTHLTFGVLTGIGLCGLFPQVPLSASGLAVVAISSLATDLDEPRGLLGQRIAVSPWRIKSGLWSLGVAVMLYAYLSSFLDTQRMVFAGVGAFLILLGLFIKDRNARKMALVLTGLGLLVAGVYVHYWWIISLGIFIGISPFLKHRTWCHSLIGAAAWTWIWSQAGLSLHIEHAAYYAAVGYLSHLVGDTLTKNGVMWLYPCKVTLKIPLISTGSKTGDWVEWLVCASYGLGVAALYGIHFTAL